jgi:DNA polymerase-3 subunit delta'
MSADTPESDRIEGASHPRDTARLIGHAPAEKMFLDAYNAGKLHHAWLMTGPRGVGKATLAWRMARFLLATPASDGGMFDAPAPETLDISADQPIARRIAAGSESRAALIRPLYDAKKDKLAAIIDVEQIRDLKASFSLKATDGGRRTVVVDSIDEMNPNAANAFLKLLEEPPSEVTFFLISHRPSGLLPTIRSRCRELRIGPLSPSDLSDALTAAGGEVDPAQRVALAELAGGSVGAAFELTNLNGLTLYQMIVDLLSGLPNMNRARLQTICDAGAGKGNEPQFDMIVTLLDLFMARTARAGSMGGLAPDAAKGEGDLIARLAATPDAALAWANLAQVLGVRARRGRAVNLDPASLLLDMLLAIESEARSIGVIGQRA